MLKNEKIEIRSFTKEQRALKLSELEKELFYLRFKQKTMQLNDTSQFKKVGHLIAFIKMLDAQYVLSQEVASV
jgi:ribosomal protein L29